MRRVIIVASALLLAAGVLNAPAGLPEPPGSGPLAPEAALRSIKARPGFTVELVAAEPVVKDPIAFDWGPDGKLWVVEMGDYPLGMDNKGKPGGRILCLEDPRGEGRYTKATVFLDNLLHPTGVMAWHKGVLVTCAPDIFYAEDTDGDGRADKREVLFTGFGEVNPQHRVNGLRWGLDNWVYCANGDFAPVRQHVKVPGPKERPRGTSFTAQDDILRLAQSGAEIRSVRTGATFDIRNRDFRFRPPFLPVGGGADFDPETGQSQFGRDRDDWGNWFGCNNAMPIYHYALADHYLRRNPHVPSPNPRVEPPRSLTYALGPIGRDTGTPRNSKGNAFTSACSVTVYRDDLFGPEFAHSWFVSEPVHNLIHRELLVQAGATFTSRRPPDEPQSEFLASSDPWFTPTTIRTGPDGALWVADMYRKVIEHPNWIPKGWEKRIDVRAGADQGRIYRVYPADKKPRAIPRLDHLDGAGLVAALDSPNGWQRDTAQQLHLQRNDRATVPLLEKQALESKRALCRLQSLCTLDGLNALTAAVLEHALGDRDPGVRRHAVRLCETRLAGSPGLGRALINRADDCNPQVALQLAYTLGEWDDPEAARALALLLEQAGDDPYLAAAALSSVSPRNIARVVEAVKEHLPETQAPATIMEGLLRSATGFACDGAAADLLERLARPAEGKYAPWQYAALAGWLDALDQRNTPIPVLARQGSPALKGALGRLAGLFAAARALTKDSRRPGPEFLPALRLLGRGPDHREGDLAALAGLLVPQTAGEVQAAAVASLGQLRSADVAEILLRGWKGYGPALRGRVLDVLFRRDEWTNALLQALERKEVLASEIDAPRRQRLLEHAPAAVRERAARLLGGAANPDRQKVVDAYKAVLSLPGDAARGRLLFTKTCATCHRLGDIGQAVGPDLAMVRDKPADWFLPAILDPNQAVEAKYVGYLAVTKNGVTLTGVLAAESGNSVTLVGPDGKPQVILRTNLEELASTGKSAMPEGLEKDLRPQDVADVIAFIRGGSWAGK